jgi:hypothetical protein
MRFAESERGSRSTSWDFGNVVMKCARRQEGPGKPVSPGGRIRVVGDSMSREAKGMARTVSA